tara:strand:- start:156 stop:500 length:345 start_codon:yes stop_codon:yes gene_type:complete
MEWQTHNMTYNIDICTDCLVYLANGDLPEDGDWKPEDIGAQWPVKDYYLSLGHYLTVYPTWHEKAGEPYSYEDHNEEDYPPSDPEPSFSSAPCGACDSRFGGERHAACAIQTSK